MVCLVINEIHPGRFGHCYMEQRQVVQPHPDNKAPREIARDAVGEAIAVPCAENVSVSV